jgi:alanyl-tRNA synthetase
VHVGEVVSGNPCAGDTVVASVDADRRREIMRNHTATHLLHRELRRVLGDHVHQAGSVVAPDRLRFDFTHSSALSAAELAEVERGVYDAIVADHAVAATEMGYREALAAGSMALFSEKYGDVVRVLRVGDAGHVISQELCGGTHVTRTGQIGYFRILSEEGIGSGLRRIEAVSGFAAQQMAAARLRELDQVGALLHVTAGNVEGALSALRQELAAAGKESQRLRRQLALLRAETLVERAADVGGARLVAAVLEEADMQTLREASDWLRDRLGSAVVVLATVIDGKPQLIAAVSEDLVARGVSAGTLIRPVAQSLGGSGGGRPALAQAGGRDAGHLAEAMALVPDLVRGQLRAMTAR